MTTSSRVPLTLLGLLLLLAGSYLLAKPVMPLTEDEKVALHALHVGALTDTLHTRALVKAGIDPQSFLIENPDLRTRDAALRVADSIEAEKLIELGKSKPPERSEVVNLQLLTIGQTCALIGAILLAAAWRPASAYAGSRGAIGSHV